MWFLIGYVLYLQYLLIFFFKEFRHNIVKLCLRIHSYFENVMTKFMISNGTDG